MAQGTFKFNFGSTAATVEADEGELLVQKSAEFLQFVSESQVCMKFILELLFSYRLPLIAQCCDEHG
jgi:hypothetical protein